MAGGARPAGGPFDGPRGQRDGRVPRAMPSEAGPAGPEWDALVRAVDACRACPLGATRAHPVVYRGGAAPRVVFVGEAPGAAEDAAGRPFVGRAGRTLDALLGDLGLDEDAVGILNVVKCHPPGNRLPPASVRACRPFLDRQLALLRPRLVVTLGRHALEALDPGSPPVLASAGTLRRRGPPGLFALLHPAATFRSRRFRDRWIADAAALRRCLAETL